MKRPPSRNLKTLAQQYQNEQRDSEAVSVLSRCCCCCMLPPSSSSYYTPPPPAAPSPIPVMPLSYGPTLPTVPLPPQAAPTSSWAPAPIPAPAPAPAPVSVSTQQIMQQQSIYGSAAAKAGKRKYLRTAAGEIWEDPTLAEWDPNDFRIFVGDIGNEVTEEILKQAFSKYSSVQKVKIIRDRRLSKSQGYGFVSFKDPLEGVRALREMNGKYIGNRPCKLRKSNWAERNLDRAKLKELKKQKSTIIS